MNRATRRALEREQAAARRRERRRRAGIAAGAALGAAAFTASSAQAANTIQVTSLADDGSAGTLRNAIQTANTNNLDNVITFADGLTGTITLASGELQINTLATTHTLEIQGPGSGNLTVSGNDASRVFEIGTGSLAVTGKVTISGLTISHGNGTVNGTSPGNGGGILINGLTPVDIKNSVVTANATAAGTGGGIFTAGALGVSGSTISSNKANYGAGIETNGSASPLTVSDSVVTGNEAATSGGGIDLASTTSSVGPTTKYSPASSVIERTTIANNKSGDDGAGINLRAQNNNDDLTVSASTIAGNQATGSGATGGGIQLTNNSGALRGSFDLVDSTVSGNSAASGGAVGIGAAGLNPFGGQGSAAIDNSTIAGNTSGIFLADYTNGTDKLAPTIELTSTIVAGNNGPDLALPEAVTRGGFDLSYSLVQNPGTAPVTQTPAASSIIGSDPKLGALANNGGPTQTMLPDQTSPVIDRGKSPSRLTTDQRGLARIVDGDPGNSAGGDGSDIGAVEVQDPPKNPPATTGGGDQSGGGGSGGGGQQPTGGGTVLPQTNNNPEQNVDALPTAAIKSIKLNARSNKSRRATGTASDDKAVVRVEIAIVRKKGKLCSELRSNGTFTRPAKCNATPKNFIVAQGTTKWSFPWLQKLPKGSYTLFARAVDSAGHVESTFGKANKKTFKV